MKNLFLLSLIVFVASCNATKMIPFSRTGMVKCVEKDRTTITLESESTASSFETSKEYAVRNAFENLLFKGVPDSNQERPLVSNESSFMSDHKTLYNNLIKAKEYQLFILQSDVVDTYKTNTTHVTKVKLHVDLKAFKTYLEKNGAIRKFGI